MSDTTLVILSGGMDSAVLLAEHVALGPTHAVSFNYGQRHVRELDAAHAIAAHYGVPHAIIDLTDVGALLTGSALTSDAIAVPDGHYEAESMRSTVVSNRNAIFLTIAVGIAASAGIENVAIGVHAGDHHIYPDCRPSFIRIFRQMERIALDGAEPAIVAPYLNHTKADIVRIGAAIDVPFALTYSCYKGEAAHCGTCGTCVERHEAFERAGLHDPTTYIQGAPA